LKKIKPAYGVPDRHSFTSTQTHERWCIIIREDRLLSQYRAAAFRCPAVGKDSVADRNALSADIDEEVGGREKAVVRRRRDQLASETLGAAAE
jgi:hypothetical protein